MKPVIFLTAVLLCSALAADDEAIVIYGNVCPLEILEPLAVLVNECIAGDTEKPDWAEECFHIAIDYFCDDGYGAQALKSLELADQSK